MPVTSAPRTPAPTLAGRLFQDTRAREARFVDERMETGFGYGPGHVLG